MMEKNFEIDTTSEYGHIYINNLDGEHMSWRELEETLNQLFHENQQLYSTNMEMKDYCARLEETNQQLKTDLATTIENTSKQIRKLKKEKNVLMKAYFCPNCTNDLKLLQELRAEFEHRK